MTTSRISGLFNVCLKFGPGQQMRRFTSAWIKSDGPMKGGRNVKDIDVERLFTRDDVQELLKRLTGSNLESKLFATRKTNRMQRSHYALMTDEVFEKTIAGMKDVGQHFLQFVPILEPRSSTPIILESNSNIKKFDDSKFMFTDLSFGLGVQIRSVVIRDTNGVLRSATPEEKDRMSRVYKSDLHRPVFEPALFRDPYLQAALDRDDHEYVLDWACYYYYPNSPTFVNLYQTIFDRTIAAEKFSLLHSTRHFGPFIFYLVLNHKHSPVFNFYAQENRLKDAADLIRLERSIFSVEAVSQRLDEVDDRIILQEYIKENPYQIEILKLLECENQPKSSQAKTVPHQSLTTVLHDTPTLDKNAFVSEKGPLGEMAKEYSVNVIGNTTFGIADSASQKENQRVRKGPDRRKPTRR